MKYDCDIVKDLLPLYQDGTLSQKSRSIVQEHLLDCSSCQEYGEKMSKELISRINSDMEPEVTAGYAKLAGRLRIRKAVMWLCTVLAAIIVLFGAFSYASGRRFDALKSSQCSHWIDDQSILLGEAGFDSYRVFVYENEDKYRTIMTKYTFPFWYIGSDSWANKTDDKVKLVGWCSYSDRAKGITIVPIQSFDDKVAYVEMGTGTNYLKKAVKTGDVVIFAWNKGISWNDLNAVASSADGNPLYKLGYEVVNSTVHIDELRWLPVTE